MKVCVYAICKNESRFARRWMSSMSEADGIYVLDTGSEDGTPQLLSNLGAEVEIAHISPWRFDTARNRSLALVPVDADICVCTDLDEVFHPGWRALLEAAWREGTHQAAYRYTWNFNPDGSEGYVFWQEKIHCRRGWEWAHPVHEVPKWLGPGQPNKIYVDGIQLDHLADQSKSRSQYLPLLELSVREEPDDDRNMHYLGREYFFHGMWERAIETLTNHVCMPSARWADERCASMRYIARSYLALGDRKKAVTWMLRAVAEAQHLREPYVDMAKMLYAEEDWDGVIYFTRQALKITERPRTYICESESWGSLPWDLLSLGLYYTGRYEEAVFAVEHAMELSPTDERLRRNLELMREKITIDKRGEV